MLAVFSDLILVYVYRKALTNLVKELTTREGGNIKARWRKAIMKIAHLRVLTACIASLTGNIHYEKYSTSTV